MVHYFSSSEPSFFQRGSEKSDDVLPGVDSVVRAIARPVVGFPKSMAGIRINYDFDFVVLPFQVCSNLRSRGGLL
jgi:hypothetical protein